MQWVAAVVGVLVLSGCVDLRRLDSRPGPSGPTVPPFVTASPCEKDLVPPPPVDETHAERTQVLPSRALVETPGHAGLEVLADARIVVWLGYGGFCGLDKETGELLPALVGRDLPNAPFAVHAGRLLLQARDGGGRMEVSWMDPRTGEQYVAGRLLGQHELAAAAYPWLLLTTPEHGNGTSGYRALVWNLESGVQFEPGIPLLHYDGRVEGRYTAAVALAGDQLFWVEEWVQGGRSVSQLRSIDLVTRELLQAADLALVFWEPYDGESVAGTATLAAWGGSALVANRTSWATVYGKASPAVHSLPPGWGAIRVQQGTSVAWAFCGGCAGDMAAYHLERREWTTLATPDDCFCIAMEIGGGRLYMWAVTLWDPSETEYRYANQRMRLVEVDLPGLAQEVLRNR